MAPRTIVVDIRFNKPGIPGQGNGGCMLSIDQYHHKVDKADSIQFTVANQNVGLTRAEIDWRTAWPFAGKARTIKLNAANGWTDTLALNGTVVGYAVYTVNVYFPNGFNAESWAAIDPDMEINP